MLNKISKLETGLSKDFKNTVTKLEQDLISIADGENIIAGTKEKTKIHIHTNEPGKLFKFSGKFGKVINQKAYDMFKQNEDAFIKIISLCLWQAA